MLPHRSPVQPHDRIGPSGGWRSRSEVWFRHRSQEEGQDLHWGTLVWIFQNIDLNLNKFTCSAEGSVFKICHWRVLAFSPTVEKQPESDLLVVGKGCTFFRRKGDIQDLPDVPGQQAVHSAGHSVLWEDVRLGLCQHRRVQHHQGQNKHISREIYTYTISCLIKAQVLTTVSVGKIYSPVHRSSFIFSAIHPWFDPLMLTRVNLKFLQFQWRAIHDFNVLGLSSVILEMLKYPSLNFFMPILLRWHSKPSSRDTENNFP